MNKTQIERLVTELESIAVSLKKLERTVIAFGQIRTASEILETSDVEVDIATKMSDSLKRLFCELNQDEER